MCKKIVDFCTCSPKPLIIGGSFITLLLAIAIGYTGCNTYKLYYDLDPQVAETHSLSYYLQLLASIYLIIITVLACLAAYYDQKHSIRALTILTSLNFVLAVAAILVVPSGTEIAMVFGKRLEEARGLYDFEDKPKLKAPALEGLNGSPIAMSSNGSLAAAASTGNIEQNQDSTNNKRVSRDANNNNNKMDKVMATKIWDSLQERGCCGYRNSTEWITNGNRIPKSCCQQPIDNMNEKLIFCKEVDEDHKRPCIELIGLRSLNLLIILGLIALVNLYLSTIFGLNAYRTFHYNEASQNAYT